MWNLVSCLELWKLVSCLELWNLVSCLEVWNLVPCLEMWNLVSCLEVWNQVSCLEMWNLVCCVFQRVPTVCSDPTVARRVTARLDFTATPSEAVLVSDLSPDGFLPHCGLH